MKPNRRKRITTIALTAEQRAAIEAASDREHGRLTDGLLKMLAYWQAGHPQPEPVA
jgi:hypothetical protein